MLEYKQAIQKWGEAHQKLKAIEEICELSVQLAKEASGLPTEDIEGEIADVIIMIEQLKLMYPNWKYAFNRKIERLNQKLSRS